MTLMLFGVLGSIITVQLFLTSDLPIEVQKPWEASNSDERRSIPPSTVNSTSEIPTAAPDQNSITDKFAPKALESESHVLPQYSDEIPEISTPFSTEIDDIASDDLSPVTEAVQEELPVTDYSPMTDTREDAYQQISSLPSSMTDSILLPTSIEQATEPDHDCPPLFSVTFERSSTQPIELDLDEKAKKLQRWLSRYPESILLIDGHTDSSGPEELNLEISALRADAIYELLAKSGISKDQMGIRAFGEFAPLHGIPSESGNNRRVFLRVEGVDACQESQAYGEVR